MLDTISRPSVLIRDATRKAWLRLCQPKVVLRAQMPDEAPEVIRQAEDLCISNGWHAAGYVAYEAAPGFDAHLTVKPSDGFPAAWFGLFENPEVMQMPVFHPSTDIDWQADEEETEYADKLSRIRNLIEAGDTYQTNYTIRLKAHCGATQLSHLISDRNGEYSAIIQIDGWTIVSGSPELFFERTGEDITSIPMKGTRPRGLTLDSDLELMRELANSEKDKAENLMIVDMVRNDLGRIAIPGSVEVSDLFHIHKYNTVWQMVSTVKCRTQAPSDQVFCALFPPASITGAPKRRAMEIIADLENSPRGVYTGTIGLIRPDGSAQFNVAIRTATIDEQTGVVSYGVGGGIVWDSDPKSEWNECWTKAKALSTSEPDFDILETLKWSPETGFFLMDRHLNRMCDSAEYFDYPFDRALSIECLEKAVDGCDEVVRVRLLLSRFGDLRVEICPMPPVANQVRVRLAGSPVSSNNRFLYHKTTHRTVYESALASCSGFDDALLWNERGELTESTISNLAIQLDGVRYTPPVCCGLLPGTLRAQLLENGELEERVLTADNLDECEGIFLLNSVRGVYQVQLV